MPYIYVNVLRTGLENITKLYPWFIESTYVGCWKVAELIVLYTLALLGFIFNSKLVFM